MDPRADFLSQLRTIHFWLVVLAIGLLVTSSLPKSVVYDRAYEQATELASINAVLTKEELLRTADAMPVPTVAKVDPDFPGKVISWEYGGTRCTYLERTVQRDKVNQKYSIWINQPNREPAYLFPYELPQEVTKAVEERTLVDVINIWKLLANDTNAIAIAGVQIEHSGKPPTIELGGSGERQPKAGVTRTCEAGNITFTLNRSLQSPMAGTINLQGESYFKESSANGSSSGGGGPFKPATVPVELVAVEFPFFERHLGDYFAANESVKRLGVERSFEEVFPELTKVSRGLETLRLEDLRAYLGSEAEAKDIDVEISGAKLPVEVLWMWGLPILIIIQLYFWLHLRVFRNRHQWHAASETFPWIALYSDLFARIVTLCSVALAPIAAIAIAVSTWGPGFKVVEGVRITGAISASLLLTILTAANLWRLSGSGAANAAVT
jgi:hypothetical protein